MALTGHGYEERSANGDLTLRTDSPGADSALMRAEVPQSAAEMDLPLHDVPPRPESPHPVRHAPASSGRGIAAGLLVVGLLAGFVAGFVVGQRMAVPLLPTVADVPRPAGQGAEAPPSVINAPDVAPVAEPRAVGAGDATR